MATPICIDSPPHSIQISTDNPKGMDAALYKAAVRGSYEDMSSISNWKEQRTPSKNNILHVYVGQPLRRPEKKGTRSKIIGFFGRKFSRNDEVRMIEIQEPDKFIEKVMEDEINDGYMLLWQSNDYGDTPLHLAARFGHENAIETCLERVKTMNPNRPNEVGRLMKMTNKSKDTALHEAARAGHAGVLKLLVEADPDCPHHEPNEEGETPLYLAAESGSTASVQSILETCNAHGYLACKGPCGRTALHAAVQWGDSGMVSKILEKDIVGSLMRIQNDEGLTPLHCVAAEWSNLKLLEILLENDKTLEKDYSYPSSAVYIQDKMGRTALHIAMLRENGHAMMSLIDCCPDCVEVVDDKGQNVLHYAARWTSPLAMWRYVRGLKHVDKLINSTDIEGNTPLHVLADFITHSSNSDLSDYINLSRLLRWFKGEKPSLDLKAFNKQNLTAGDILQSSDTLPTEHFPEYLRPPTGKRIIRYEKEVVDVEARHVLGADRDAHLLKKAAQSQLVVVTLIATVSFTAAFTVPGGFDQNAGKNMGMAVFREKPLFKVFLLFDATAFVTSISAVFLYFMLLSGDTSLKSRFLAQLFSVFGFLFTIISSVAMMIAFVAGICEVSSSTPLNLSIIIATSLVFGQLCLFLIGEFLEFAGKVKRSRTP